MDEIKKIINEYEATYNKKPVSIEVPFQEVFKLAKNIQRMTKSKRLSLPEFYEGVKLLYTPYYDLKKELSNI